MKKSPDRKVEKSTKVDSGMNNAREVIDKEYKKR